MGIRGLFAPSLSIRGESRSVYVPVWRFRHYAAAGFYGAIALLGIGRPCAMMEGPSRLLRRPMPRGAECEAEILHVAIDAICLYYVGPNRRCEALAASAGLRSEIADPTGRYRWQL